MGISSWAVITGAGSGIGSALTKELAKEGLKVLAIGRRLNMLEQTKWNSENPENIVSLAVDIASSNGRHLIFNSIPETDKVKFLVQNAAVGVPNKLADIDIEEFEYAMAVNVTAPLMLSKGFLSRLNESSGRIIHLGTGVALKPQLGTTTYGVTKMAFHRLYQQLEVELDPYNVSVANILPGVVDTEGLWEHIKLANEQNLPHVKYFDNVQEQGLMLKPEESAKFIKYVLIESTDAEFPGEWNIHDQSHWSKWK